MTHVEYVEGKLLDAQSSFRSQTQIVLTVISFVSVALR